MSVGFVCGPAKGTEEEPYRCNCCRRTFADMEQLAVSICWECTLGDEKCRSCRRNGVFISDSRFGTWQDRASGKWMKEFDPEGHVGHRLAVLNGKNVRTVCGTTIQRRYLNVGGGSAVIPECPTCWADE